MQVVNRSEPFLHLTFLVLTVKQEATVLNESTDMEELVALLNRFFHLHATQRDPDSGAGGLTHTTTENPDARAAIGKHPVASITTTITIPGRLNEPATTTSQTVVLPLVYEASEVQPSTSTSQPSHRLPTLAPSPAPNGMRSRHVHTNRWYAVVRGREVGVFYDWSVNSYTFKHQHV